MSGYMAVAAKEDWKTPPEVIAVVRAALGGAIALDPCASPRKADHFARHNIHPPRNGLIDAWPVGSTFINPPFGDLAEWAARVEQMRGGGRSIIMLLPSRTDTRFWHGVIAHADAICFWKGRISFVGAEGPCPFATAFAYWGPHRDRFTDAFIDHGMVVRP